MVKSEDSEVFCMSHYRLLDLFWGMSARWASKCMGIEEIRLTWVSLSLPWMAWATASTFSSTLLLSFSTPASSFARPSPSLLRKFAAGFSPEFEVLSPAMTASPVSLSSSLAVASSCEGTTFSYLRHWWHKREGIRLGEWVWVYSLLLNAQFTKKMK